MNMEYSFSISIQKWRVLNFHALNSQDVIQNNIVYENSQTKKSIIYTIARPMGLKDDPLVTDYRESFDSIPPKASSIPRASVAHFMVKALSDAKYENASVGITK